VKNKNKFPAAGGGEQRGGGVVVRFLLLVIPRRSVVLVLLQQVSSCQCLSYIPLDAIMILGVIFFVLHENSFVVWPLCE